MPVGRVVPARSATPGTHRSRPARRKSYRALAFTSPIPPPISAPVVGNRRRVSANGTSSDTCPRRSTRNDAKKSCSRSISDASRGDAANVPSSVNRPKTVAARDCIPTSASSCCESRPGVSAPAPAQHDCACAPAGHASAARTIRSATNRLQDIEPRLRVRCSPSFRRNAVLAPWRTGCALKLESRSRPTLTGHRSARSRGPRCRSRRGSSAAATSPA